ncbi:MAG: hypothetical protein JWQ54_2719 [Mucilaginibacter sp.]|nr:hypothetical protein [Mucilaginibacter sp.]
MASCTMISGGVIIADIGIKILMAVKLRPAAGIVFEILEAIINDPGPIMAVSGGFEKL